MRGPVTVEWFGMDSLNSKQTYPKGLLFSLSPTGILIVTTEGHWHRRESGVGDVPTRSSDVERSVAQSIESIVTSSTRLMPWTIFPKSIIVLHGLTSWS